MKIRKFGVSFRRYMGPTNLPLKHHLLSPIKLPPQFLERVVTLPNPRSSAPAPPTSNSLYEMAPLPPAQPKGLRRPPPRSASFHARAAEPPAEPRNMRRPKTQPDLLAAWRKASPKETPSCIIGAAERKVPVKVLVNVTVQGSLGPVQVMASTEWTVGDLVAAAAKIYMQGRRRPPLPDADSSAFSLHYSQFSLESLDSQKKLIELGSRNFFLCPNAASSGSPTGETAGPPPPPPPPPPSFNCSKEADNGPRTSIPLLRFMDFLL